ncbi:DNA polymerase III subunit gamma/tau [Algibacillus agarilyticus]|uniref:DNA polymerase III subunit gamma/tau n=1 Tax=Algibacillus agarilyticus TaxID=2234133 RepID=UPI000DD0B301|nr:DNA polymerase III subunit gamma/tau [Algibacillus agarilyticus]
MSYQVLARKWRPQIFSELVGQSHVVTALSNALTNDRLHHAYLFTGTRGVGKTTIARIFSKSLNCVNGVTAEPCGQCQNCSSIEEGRFVDLVEVDAASRTKVEDTREILDNVQYRPSQGRYKVYLIDEVHMLSRHSFNALLKTLEEPPPHVKFLLATTDPQKLPITILSRCLQFSLKALTPEQINKQLAHVLTAESLPFEAAALDKLSLAANGSMRDALSLTDQAIAQGNGKVGEQIVRSMLGMLDEQHIAQLLTALVSADFDAVMNAIDQLSLAAVEPSQALLELINALHQVALVQVLPSYKRLNPALATLLTELSQQLSAEQIQLYYQILLDGRKDLPYAANPRSGLEMTLLRVLSFAPVKTINPDVITAEVTEKKTELNRELNTELNTKLKTERSASDVKTSKPDIQVDNNISEGVVDNDADSLQHSELTSVHSEPEPLNVTDSSVSHSAISALAPAESIQNVPSAIGEQVKAPSDSRTTKPEVETELPRTLEPEPEQKITTPTAALNTADTANVLMDVHEQMGSVFASQFDDPGYGNTHESAEYDPAMDADYHANSIENEFPPSEFEPLIDDEYLSAQQAQIESLAASQGFDQSGVGSVQNEPSDIEQSNHKPLLIDENVTAESLDIMGALLGIRAQKKQLADKQETENASNRSFKDQAPKPSPSVTNEAQAADTKPEQNDSELGLSSVEENHIEQAIQAPGQPFNDPSINNQDANAINSDAHEHDNDVPWVDEFSGDMFAESSDELSTSDPLSTEREPVNEPIPAAVNHTANSPVAPEIQPGMTNGASLAPSHSINDLSLQEKVRGGVIKSAEVDLWAEVVDSADLIGLQRQFALHSTLEQQGDLVVLSLQAEHAHLDTENNRLKITAALQKALGQQVALQVNIADRPQVTPFNIQTHIDVERLDYAKELILSDVNVQALQEHFNAEIDLESIKAI